MTWKFHVHASEQRRLFSRILQILESQRVIIHSFSGEMDDHGVCLTSFVVSSEDDKAYRIEALLHRLEDVHSVSVLPKS
jgi:(p)ppGpp synthase/HD superfamily hydrolase